MKSSAVAAGDTATAAQYNDLRQDAQGGSFLKVHAQASPGMTVKIEAGFCFIGLTKVNYAGGNSGTITAPATNPRIDLIVINSSGTISAVTGTEAASPSVPTYPEDKMVLAEIYLRVGATSIKDADDSTNGYIQNDVRPFLHKGRSFNTLVRAGSNAAQVITDTSFYIVQFDTETFDLLSEYNNGSGVFTATYAGYYRVHASIQINPVNTAKSATLYIRRNTVIQSGVTFYNVGTDSQNIEIHDIISLTAGQTIDIYFGTNDSSGATLGNNSGLQRLLIERIG